jgi:TolB-like protein
MPDPATPHSSRRWLWALAAVLLLAALSVLYIRWRPRHASAKVRMLAVLPASGAEQQWMSEGLAQEIIDALLRFPDLHVSPQRPAPPPPTGASADTAAILGTSVLLAGDGLTVTVQMTRASDGYKLWTAEFHTSRQDGFILPARIADALASRIGVSARKYAARPGPALPAYDAYLEGRALLNRWDAGSCNQAEERLTEATRIDPEFAPAWAWLAMAIDCRVEDGLERPNAAMPTARDAAERAVALDPNSAAAHLALAIVKLQYDWDWSAAKPELDRALELSPGSTVVRRWRARWYETQGRLDEAKAEDDRAKALDPNSAIEPAPSPFAHAEAAARKGDDTEAHSILDQAEDLRAERYIPAAAFTSLAAADGDWDTVFQWLEVEYDERSLRLPYARMIPGLPQADPRFTDLLERMNLPVK